MVVRAWFQQADRSIGVLLAPASALALGLLVLRVPELDAVRQSGADLGGAWARMTLQDIVSWLRGLPLWCFLAWPFLWLRSTTVRHVVWGVMGSAVLVSEAALIHYFAVSGVPLGADLWAYSMAEVVTTVNAANASVPTTWLLALLASCMLFWGVLGVQARRAPLAWPAGSPSALMMAGVLAWIGLPGQWPEGLEQLEQNKLQAFGADVLEKKTRFLTAQTARPLATDPLHPFARAETTPDTLSPLFALQDKARPHLLFIIVEGLGRSFSGPGARLGSFTPFLDDLAKRSLYWDNFLATQGRTFSVLPSMLGSLPQGVHAYPNLPHDSLLSLLRAEGYGLRYFTGSNVSFDRQGEYLGAAGVKFQYSEADFQQPQRRLTEWGYADGELFEAVAAHLRAPATAPQVTVVQTMSMHTPFVFPGLESYRTRVDAHLARLGIAGEARAPYVRQRDIYASILYTDEVLRRFFDQLSRTPDWANTLVVITGDHRLPEIPMATRLERYHVPLIIASPLLRAPRKIAAVSSHFDVAPALLAMLAKHYGIQTPATVSWMGAGLDIHPEFRNLHALPLQQTKTELSDYVSGPYYLGKGKLYRLSEDLQPEPVEDAVIAAKLDAELENFRVASDVLASGRGMVPPAEAARRIGYDARQRQLDIRSSKFEQHGIVVSGAVARMTAPGKVEVQARFTHHSDKASPVFVPLLVLTDAQGQQWGEVSGKAVRLAAGEVATYALEMRVDPQKLATGQHFVAMVVSHPDTGKSMGQGQYRVALVK